MSSADLINLAITVGGIVVLLSIARYIKQRELAPAVSRWLLFIGYNGLVGGVLLAGHLLGWGLPRFLAPVLIVGGNGAMISVWGPPSFGLRRRAKQPAADPGRERIEPKPRKKRRKRRH